MDISWDDAKLFLAVAETGSLSAAARRLAMGQPTVTRRLAQLEYTVGNKLFRRSVEGASLTAAGERLLPPAKKMAEWAGELQRAAESSDGSPAGLVRVTASPSLCFDFLAPFSAFVASNYPKLRLELLSSVEFLDLVRGEADVAVRSQVPTNPDLKLICSREWQNAVMVTPELKAKLPKRPKFSDVPWVAWAPPFEAVTPNPQLRQLITNFVPAFTSDNYLVQLAAAEAGAGAIVHPRVRHRFSRSSSLVPLAIDLGPYRTSSMHLVCSRSALDIARVRKITELIEAELFRK